MTKLPTVEVLTDSLGLLVPDVTLARDEGPCPTYPACRHADGYCRYVRSWYVNSTAEQLGRGRYRWPTLDDARTELTSAGFVVDDKPCNPAGSYLATHTATARELDRRNQADAEKWRDAEPCFVRFGELPPDGHSRDHRSGRRERGVSVFRGERLPTGEARALPRTNDQLGSLLTLAGRPLYVVEGVEVWLGADGEPLLGNARIVVNVRADHDVSVHTAAELAGDRAGGAAMESPC